jgi:hypothetical protein
MSGALYPNQTMNRKTTAIHADAMLMIMAIALIVIYLIDKIS